MINKALFSSASEHWSTPLDVYHKLNAEFSFDFDPCPLHGLGADGLATDWSGKRVFCNPPYGRGIGEWLAKHGEPILCVYLIPARTDTRWWHVHVMKATEIRFLRGRLKFGGSKNSAPFPSALAIFQNFNRFSLI